MSLGSSNGDVLGWVPQETDSGRDLGAEGLFGSICVRVERSRIRQMEMWNCEAFTRGVSANLGGSPGSKMALSISKI